MGELRIIGGKARGRKIKSPKGLHVRPLLGRIKKSFFDIIQNDIKDANFLDLFSGTGSIGLEAISRGAGKVTFVEKHPVSLKILMENINLLGFEKQVKVIHSDVLSILENLSETFDIIFADPPFACNFVEELLNSISRNGILKSNGIFVIHRPVYEVSYEIAGSLKTVRKINYGQNTVCFYTVNE
jgi:16S rRNA (guanine(966)-N(2))-methyltransferase RsmD